jgi:hypothetical protein
MILHFCFGNNCTGQVIVPPNSGVFVIVAGGFPKVIGGPLLAGLLSVKVAFLTLPSFTLPKFFDDGLTTRDSGTAVGVDVGVGVTVAVGVAVAVAVAVLVAVALEVAVAVAVAVGVAVEVAAVAVAVEVAVAVAVAVGVAVGVAEGAAAAYAFTKVVMSTVPQPVTKS